MLKRIINSVLSQVADFIKKVWHNFYFHWQLKDKTGYVLLGAFIFVLISIPNFYFSVNRI